MERTDLLLQNTYFLFIVVAGAIFLLATSGKFVNQMMNLIYNKSIQEISAVTDEHQSAETPKNAGDEQINRDRISTGLIIGKCENIIILLLTITNSYTAIALIFTAKTIIRKEDIGKNSIFFLAGTLLNVTYSLIVSYLIVLLVKYTTIY